MSAPVAGRRVFVQDNDTGLRLSAGDYGQDRDGRWWARPPCGAMGWLMNHTITEHPDKTITVEPSILSDDWHGFLRHGVWEEA